MSTFDPLALARPEIRALKPYASARALAGASGILLNANENPYAPQVESELSLNRYPDPQPARLKQRLAARYGVNENQLLITRGSDEGIDLLLRVFCRPNQDQVLICPPCFGMYGLSARIQGAVVIESPLIDTDAGFTINPNMAEQARNCRISFLCSPNNPTGNVIQRSALREFLKLQLERQQLVVMDEAYIEFAPDHSSLDLMDEFPNLIVLRTLSKAYALAGCRIGVAIANADIIALLRRIIAPYPLPTPTVELALQALSESAYAIQQQQLATMADEKTRLLAVLETLDTVQRIWPGHANFVLIKVEDAKDLIQQASEAGIRLRDQSAQPGLDNTVRISIGQPQENQALIDFLQGRFSQ